MLDICSSICFVCTHLVLSFPGRHSEASCREGERCWTCGISWEPPALPNDPARGPGDCSLTFNLWPVSLLFCAKTTVTKNVSLYPSQTLWTASGMIHSPRREMIAHFTISEMFPSFCHHSLNEPDGLHVFNFNALPKYLRGFLFYVWDRMDFPPC